MNMIFFATALRLKQSQKLLNMNFTLPGDARRCFREKIRGQAKKHESATINKRSKFTSSAQKNRIKTYFWPYEWKNYSTRINRF